LLEKRTGIGQHGVVRGRELGGGVAHAQVEEQEARRGKHLLALAAAEGLDANSDEHVLEKLVVVLDRTSMRSRVVFPVCRAPNRMWTKGRVMALRRGSKYQRPLCMTTLY
jgi:hypothetical protein